MPEDTAEALSSDASAIAVANLRTVVESSALLSEFQQSGISLLFLKGLTLGALAYENPALKSAADIDILVERHQLTETGELLRKRGYQLVEPNPQTTSSQLDDWHRLRKESLWYQSSQKLWVDLHTRLADNLLMIPSIGSNSAKQHVEVSPGLRLPTLAPDELFAYLCVHGASSAWFRLKWITDFAALVSQSQGDTIVRLYQVSQSFGAGRAASQALLLADEFYDVLGELPYFRQQLQRDVLSRWLSSAARSQLAGEIEPREPTSTALGTWRIHLTQFALLSGFTFLREEFRRQVATAAGGRIRRLFPMSPR